MMQEKAELERADRRMGPEGDAPNVTRQGPGRWLLTWWAVFGVVVLTAVIFIVGAFLVAD